MNRKRNYRVLLGAGALIAAGLFFGAAPAEAAPRVSFGISIGSGPRYGPGFGGGYWNRYNYAPYAYGPRVRYGRDRDWDGVPNRFDRDRDGDGLRNRRDPQPNRRNRLRRW